MSPGVNVTHVIPSCPRPPQALVLDEILSSAGLGPA
jgi:hypothetical protein